jgi:hypothetical protein
MFLLEWKEFYADITYVTAMSIYAYIYQAWTQIFYGFMKNKQYKYFYVHALIYFALVYICFI